MAIYYLQLDEKAAVWDGYGDPAALTPFARVTSFSPTFAPTEGEVETSIPDWVRSSQRDQEGFPAL